MGREPAERKQSKRAVSPCDVMKNGLRCFGMQIREHERLVQRGRKFTFSPQKPRARTQVQAMRALIQTKIWDTQV